MNDPQEADRKGLEGLYDLAMPLGMPLSVIRELVEKFELDMVEREATVDIIGERQKRKILVLRGDLDTVMEAKKYMFEALDRKIAEWDDPNRAERYRHLRQKAQAEEKAPEEPDESA
ncbi:MAG: hypothetical protein GKC10_03050 [Methanosarcinales archaeon]|nr:hypothetical protein [Methanosarcinales archaeon]